MDAAQWKGRVDFGIITIREDEFEAVLQRFPQKIGLARGRRAYNLRALELEPAAAYTIAIIRCLEQGNGEALDAARDLLEELEPRWLLVTGIAGGAPARELTLGDVVVSTRIVDFSVEAVLKDGTHEYAITGGPMHREASMLAANLPAMKDELGPWNTGESIGVDRPPIELAPERLYGDPEWQRRVTKEIAHHFGGDARAPRVIAGTLASSDRLVKDAERIQVWLRAARQFLAIEMESGGVHRATQGRNVPFLAIRGISDIVGLDRDPAWTEYACHSAAAFTLAFLRARPVQPREHDAPGQSHGPWTWFRRAAALLKPASPPAAPPLGAALPSDAAAFKGYRDLRRVYRGHYSEVYRGYSQTTGDVCVVKRSERTRVSIRALEQLAALRCGNVIVPRRVWQDADYIYEELPYISGTRLSQAVARDVGGLSGSVLELFFKLMFSTLDKLHEAGLIHRDVHPDNIFLLVRPATQHAKLQQEYPEAKYGVFGKGDDLFVLTFLLVDNTFLITNKESNRAAPVQHGCYTPPEQLDGQPTAKSDLYALGATMYFGITGCDVPPVTHRLLDPSALGPMPSGGHPSREFPGVLERMLSLDPAKRPTSSWCMETTVSPCFTGILALSDGADLLMIDGFSSHTRIESSHSVVARLEHERLEATAELARLERQPFPDETIARELLQLRSNIEYRESLLAQVYRIVPKLRPS